jgi:hypothetical protein
MPLWWDVPTRGASCAITDRAVGRVRIVAGLPGSGKTEYVKALRADGWREFDDFKACAHNNSTAFADARHYDELIQALRAGHQCVVADMAFGLDADRREADRVLRAVVPGLAIDWLFFVNDPAHFIRTTDPTRTMQRGEAYTAKNYSVPCPSAVRQPAHAVQLQPGTWPMARTESGGASRTNESGRRVLGIVTDATHRR